MYNDDSLAAAQIAKIFGSELLKVQENARTDSGSSPQIVNIDPKSFLVNNRQQKNSPQTNNHILQMLQNEAEMAYPLPPAAVSQPAPQQVSVHEHPSYIQQTKPANENLAAAALTKTQLKFDSELLEKINKNLERIANAVETLCSNHTQNEINDK